MVVVVEEAAVPREGVNKIMGVVVATRLPEEVEVVIVPVVVDAVAAGEVARVVDEVGEGEEDDS